jgi:hypothetical protein
LKGDVIYTATSLLGLTQRLLTDSSLDLVLTNFDRVGTFFADEGVVKPDAYHPSIVIEILLDLHNSTSCAHSYRKYASGDYSLLFSFLFNYDWSCVYSNNTVEAAVDSFTNVIPQAMDLALPQGLSKNSRFPHWFSRTLIYYIRKKNYFYRRYKKSKNEYHYNKFSHFQKLIKTTIKTDRLNWYKSIDDDLKTQPSKFWKYVSSFTKHNSHAFHLDINDTDVVDPTDVAEAFAKHFRVKIINAQQARVSYNYKNIKEKLLKTNSAIWLNKICRQEQLKPNYIHINVNGPSEQSSNTKKAAIRYRLSQDIKFLYRKKICP